MEESGTELWENVAKSNGDFFVSNSNDWRPGLYPILKYYDRYSYGTSYNDAAAYKRGKLGDATKEILKKSGSDNNGWNNDFSYLPDSGGPWLYRGGHASDGSYAGLFNFHRNWDGSYSAFGSRTILTIF